MKRKVYFPKSVPLGFHMILPREAQLSAGFLIQGRAPKEMILVLCGFPYCGALGETAI